MSGAANRPGRSSRKQSPARSKLKRTRSKRRRDPLLASPLLYEQLDKRQLLAGDSQADGDPAPLLLDLPPVVSATLERLLSSGGDFSSGLWRSAPDQPSSVRFVPFSAGPRASPRFSSALTPRRHVAEPDYWTSVPSPLLAFLSRASRQPPV